MSNPVRARLRDLRYALPQVVGRWLPSPEPQRMVRGRGRVTLGHFPAVAATPEQIVEASKRAIAALAPGDCLAVKAPALAFDDAAIDAIGGAAKAARVILVCDAHGPQHADATFRALKRLWAFDPATGCALPARWARSSADAERLRDTAARLRIVKGEWADGADDVADAAVGYIELVQRLAGRFAAVGIATHDPQLADRALRLLIAAGTPCELEQLRGLPSRRTRAVAAALGVPVRTYLPFGPGWWPYAIDQALARPYLPLWVLHDRFGSAHPPS